MRKIEVDEEKLDAILNNSKSEVKEQTRTMSMMHIQMNS